MVRTAKRIRLCTVLLILNLILIWGNSLLPGEISAAVSRFVRNVIAFLFSGASGNVGGGGEGILRKIAHYLEFTGLGLCLSWLIRMLVTRKKLWYLLPLLGGILVACADETIQWFVPGRSCRLYDVGIDTLGVVTGIVIISLMQKSQKQKIYNMEENKQ